MLLFAKKMIYLFLISTLVLICKRIKNNTYYIVKLKLLKKKSYICDIEICTNITH